MKLVPFIYVTLFAMNLMFWFTAQTVFSLFAAGWVAGIGFCHLIDWYSDRRLNREIMEEINAYTRIYDNQMTIYDYQNDTNQENKND